ncbi:DsbA family oxidoreductase [Paenibacillus soyae]|uniref:DsbA family oxidoreductase n=1 Tax=Paenibacillus soyae TaxID=2969249 RepID=A0A9X2MLJ0_9BACL|nr:DsbA family oxidoreductase [Paenibacillus soyae]MCR2802839.1 DsbA family oxidoreductase [Paenibacillus soyae]
MKVEIWSDFVCPFCYIGKRRLEEALAGFEHKEQVVIEYKSFELDPNADSEARMHTHEMLASKYGMSVEQAKASGQSVAGQAAAAGLEFRFENQYVQNTFDAHRLAQFAAVSGRGAEMAERLFRAYFTDNDLIGNKEVLARLAEEVGLDAGQVSELLGSEQFADVVRQQESEGSQLGIRGVPFFVIDRKYGISGAQSPAVFLDTLQKAWTEKYPELVQVQGADDAACADGYCAAPGADGDKK